MSQENSVHNPDDTAYDYDVIVVGSGFGGSVHGPQAHREGLPRRSAGSGPSLHP